MGEQIGHVTTGLSEETILSHLKTRIYMNLEEAACTDEETDFCVVCQVFDVTLALYFRKLISALYVRY